MTMGAGGIAPLEMTMLTALPTAACVVATGVWLITDPAGTVGLDALLTVPTTRPAFVMAVLAADCVRLRTLGTATITGPVDTTKSTALPGVTITAAAGF